MKENFTKSDLKTGMWVETKCGERFMVLKDCETLNYGHQDFMLVNENKMLRGEMYKDDLTRVIYNEANIMKVFTNLSSGVHSVSSRVFKPELNDVLLWERAEEINEEIQKLQQLGKTLEELYTKTSRLQEEYEALKNAVEQR